MPYGLRLPELVILCSYYQLQFQDDSPCDMIAWATSTHVTLCYLALISSGC